jgi:hypothetical protein
VVRRKNEKEISSVKDINLPMDRERYSLWVFGTLILPDHLMAREIASQCHSDAPKPTFHLGEHG